MPDPSPRRRLKVLTMVQGIGRGEGGAERLAVDIATGLDRSRFDPIVCATRATDPARADVAAALQLLRDADVPLIQLSRRAMLDLRAWRPLYSTLRRAPVDVVHAHMFGSNVWGAILGRLARVPAVVAHEHMWSFEGKPARRLVDRDVIARLSNAFITVSEAGRRLMIETEGVDPAKVVLIRNGIPDAAPGNGRRIRAELGIAPDDPVVGTVGLLRPEKALDVLVEATRPLAARIPNVRVLVVGEGEVRPQLERLIDTHGLAGTVTLTGMRLDVPDLLAAMDVAVCCSDWEGGPLSVLEYMRAALPVVATRVGGIPELLDDGEDGVLVPPRDPERLAEAIGGLLEDPDRAARLGIRARERQQREGDLGGMVTRVEQLYERLFDAARGAPAT